MSTWLYFGAAAIAVAAIVDTILGRPIGFMEAGYVVFFLVLGKLTETHDQLP